MKANDRQKQVCDLVIQQVSFWKESNDIDSPTHHCDNNESVREIDWLDDDGVEDMTNFLDNLLNYLKIYLPQE